MIRKQDFLTLSAILLILISGCMNEKTPIDRFSLVTRHNIHISRIDSLNALSVGNGGFAFTADFTGLQTFPDVYVRGISLGTMSNWGWHTDPNPEGYKLSDVCKAYNVHGRKVEYIHQFRAADDPAKAAATDWLRSNPHRIHLGMIGLQLLRKDGSEVTLTDIKDNDQSLYLWTGAIESNFMADGSEVQVLTVCHPDLDIISAKVSSALIGQGRLKAKISFPLGTAMPAGYDFSQPDKHSTEIIMDNDSITLFRRKQDNDIYYVRVLHKKSRLIKGDSHIYFLEPARADSVLEFSCQFSKEMPENGMPDFTEVHKSCTASWSDFWNRGGAVDFSECTDPRASELERRVILSRYLTRIQCSGDLPPAETGLTYNSWFGKFHLEMHWWHAVHFALWGNADVLERQMKYYSHIMGRARQTAQFQGYRGVRWPKMTDPEGRESPSNVGVYLIWQQPHPVFYAELLYQNAEDRRAVLEKYKDIVFETADFMASYAWFDTTRNRYILGPVLIPAQETLNRETTVNPVFELAYWYWGLRTAQEWKERLGQKRVPLWDDVINRLSKLPVKDGLYLCSEDTEDSYKNPRYMSDHPVVAGITGMLPHTKLINDRILGNSLDTINKVWNWKTTWGWDFPMLAMSAASIGRGEQAVDFLMMDAPKNRYLPNGHNYQDARLAIYLPGNGGLLTAVARMCVYDQFPHNGRWNVRWEKLNRFVR